MLVCGINKSKDPGHLQLGREIWSPGLPRHKATGTANRNVLLLLVAIHHRQNIIAKHMGLNPVSDVNHLSDLVCLQASLSFSVLICDGEMEIPIHGVALRVKKILNIKYLAQCLACGKYSSDETLKEGISVLPGSCSKDWIISNAVLGILE